jgi:hypothetical protein
MKCSGRSEQTLKRKRARLRNSTVVYAESARGRAVGKPEIRKEKAIPPADAAQNLEPIAAIGDPPTGYANGNGRRQSPPEGKDDIGHQPQPPERKPKNLPLHSSSLTWRGAQEARDLPKGYRSLCGRVQIPSPESRRPPRFRPHDLDEARRRLKLCQYEYFSEN